MKFLRFNKQMASAILWSIGKDKCSRDENNAEEERVFTEILRVFPDIDCIPFGGEGANEWAKDKEE